MEQYELHDIVMFQSSFGDKKRTIGVIAEVGAENSYTIRFFFKNTGWGVPIAMVRNEVQWIGHLPPGTEMDWDG